MIALLMGRGVRAGDVLIVIMMYALVRTQIIQDITSHFETGEMDMGAIDVSVLGPDPAILMPVVFFTAMAVGATAYITGATRKGDSDIAKGVKSDWDLKYIFGSIVAAIFAGAMAIVVTPMIFSGLGVVGAGAWFTAIVTGIVAMFFTRWCIIGIHEGPLEVIKDFKYFANVGKEGMKVVRKEVNEVREVIRRDEDDE